MITWILVIILVGIVTLMLDYYIYHHKAADELRRMQDEINKMNRKVRKRQDEINKKSSKTSGFTYFPPTPAAR